MPEGLGVALSFSGASSGSRWFFFRKLGVPYFGILVMGFLLFRVLYLGPLFSGNPPDIKARTTRTAGTARLSVLGG